MAVEDPYPPSIPELLETSTPDDWREPDPAYTLYMELDSGRVVIELAPQFAPAHVEQIRTLARNGYWDGLSIYRVQDNFVAQFGDADAEEGTPQLPGAARQTLPAEFERSSEGLTFDPIPDTDGWAPESGFVDGFPAGRDPATGSAWLAHCYGNVGAGRGNPPDSSNGGELYVVIGHAPRTLDRDITSVGKVLQGIEHLSVLPRGPAPMGMYADRVEHTPIRSIRLASEVDKGERTSLEVLRTDTPLFARIVETRRNRRNEWVHRQADFIDLCNITVPVRLAEYGDGD